MRTPTSPPLTPRRLAQQPLIREVPARVGPLPGILRARTGAGSSLDEQCAQPELDAAFDKLLANAEREVTDALKETLTTLAGVAVPLGLP